jgi:hypothetical protein
VDLGDGAKRWQKLLAVADAVVKVPVPRGPAKAVVVPPSEVMRDLEEKLKLNVGKDVLGRLTGAAVVVDAEAAGGPPSSPMLVLKATDAEAARFLEEQALPKLVGLTTGGEVPLPAREQVEGRRISTVAAGFFPGWKALHYGRQGPFLVLGPDRKRVALALTAGGKKEGLLGEARVADAVKALDRPVALGVASTGQGLVQLFKTSLGAPRDDRRFASVAAPPPPGGRPAEKKPAKVPEEVEKAARELAKVVEPLPPVVLSLARNPDALILEARQTSLRRVSARVINLWVEAALQQAIRGRGMGGFGGPVGAEAVEVPLEAPVPPTPPPPPPKEAKEGTSKDVKKKVEKKP